MPSTVQLVESILFIAARPLTLQKLAEITGRPKDDVASALEALMEKYKNDTGGLQLNHLGQSYQLATVREVGQVVQNFLEEEEKKELSKPSLETLTIIAYRGPVTKAELEMIRGVHCGLIIRNLLIRGLIETPPATPSGELRYQVTFDFLHYLGLREPAELPDYVSLNADEHMKKLLEEPPAP